MDNITVIGQSIFIRGNIEGEEDLSVQGKIEGNITLQNTLYLEESGIVKADVSVKNAVISGILVGNLEAKESIEITEIGIVVGDIYAPRIIIKEGAKFRGNVNMSSYNEVNEVKKIETTQPKSKQLYQSKTTTASTTSTYGNNFNQNKKPQTPQPNNTKTTVPQTNNTKTAVPQNNANKFEKKNEVEKKNEINKPKFESKLFESRKIENEIKSPSINAKIDETEAEKINKAIQDTIQQNETENNNDKKDINTFE